MISIRASVLWLVLAVAAVAQPSISNVWPEAASDESADLLIRSEREIPARLGPRGFDSLSLLEIIHEDARGPGPPMGLRSGFWTSLRSDREPPPSPR